MLWRRVKDQEVENPVESRSFLGVVREFVEIAVLAGLAIVVTRHFLILPFIVKGKSMEPSFYENEYLIVDEMTFRFRNPERGEIVVFHPESVKRLAATTPSKEFYIKRIIGLPGETVEVRNGRITIYNAQFPNGFVLTEPYLDELTPKDSVDYVTLGQDEFYVMGDNRDQSLDSRMLGPQKRADIIGRVWFRGLPFERASIFPVPDYLGESAETK